MVGGSPVAALMQWAGRSNLLLAVVDCIPEVRSCRNVPARLHPDEPRHPSLMHVGNMYSIPARAAALFTVVSTMTCLLVMPWMTGDGRWCCAALELAGDCSAVHGLGALRGE